MLFTKLRSAIYGLSRNWRRMSQKACSYDASHNSTPAFMFDFDEDGQGNQDSESARKAARSGAFIIGVCGGTASGKTSVCRKIVEDLKDNTRVIIVSQDSYYKGLSPEDSAKGTAGTFNFDHPDAFDWDLIVQHLEALKKRKPIEVPEYSFVTHQRTGKTESVYGADVILFEGILVFHDQRVRNFFDMKVFVDTDDDTRLIRRIRRDMASRGRTLESVLQQYETFVKPAYDVFIGPTKKHADIVVPRGESNLIAISLIVQHIRNELSSRRPRRR